MRKTEAEFVNEGMSPEELTTLGGNEGAPVIENDQQPDGGDNGAAQVVADTTVQPEQKTVDLRALQEARASERAAREELARFRTEQAAEKARLEERISLINQAIEAQSKPQVKVPSKDEDPLAYYDHQLETVNGKFQTIEQQLQAYKDAEVQRAEMSRAEAQRAAVIDEAQSVISVAIQSKPELQEAFDFALNGVRAEIAAMLDSQQVPYGQRQMMGEQIWRNSMANLATRCPRDPQRAAEFVMQNARYYGYGYQPQQAGVQQMGQTVQTPQQKTIQERAEQQERHLSLSGVQGGTAPTKLDAKTLVSMTDAQFNELMKTAAGRKQAEQIMAGN